jgi:naphthoate synthase
MDFQDILYEKKGGVARITINRPETRNAFRNQTLVELSDAFNDAWSDKSVGVVVLTGAGDKAFCSGGDQKQREKGGYGGAPRRVSAHHIHRLIRQIPKPVIARVNGFAIGGGHVLHVVCDLSIASENAIFGQTGPRVGSYDAGFGSAYLGRVVGEKKAREIWYLCRQYSAQEALAMGLVNKVVPYDKLDEEVDAWCKEILAKSPTALKMLKASFNADSDNIEGISAMAMGSLDLFYNTDEAMEGRNAFVEKRPVDFSKFR